MRAVLLFARPSKHHHPVVAKTAPDARHLGRTVLVFCFVALLLLAGLHQHFRMQKITSRIEFIDGDILGV